MLRLFKYPWASQGSNGQDTNVSNLKRNRSSDTVDLEEDATAVDSYVAEEPHPKRRKLAPAITNIPSYCESRDLDVFEAAKQQDLIVTFCDLKVKNYVSALLCRWACAQEEARAGKGRWKRVAVMIVDHDSAVNVHARALSDFLPELSVVGITHIGKASQDEKWLQMMGNDVLIMTHAEFMQTFEAGIIAFSQISLVVVDKPELALHKKQPLAAILLSLSATPKEEKPRVLGVISQPGGGFEFSVKALKLEELLGAQFYGVEQRKRTEVMLLVEKPLELVVRFSPPSKVVDTALCKHLRTFDKYEQLYRKEFRTAKAVLREVGSFASDWIWRRALKSMDENHMDVIFEEEEDLPMDSAVLTAKARQGVYRTIKNWTFTMPNLDPTSRGFNVSPKIARLVQILQCFQKAGDSFRGIVFVRRRITALAIVEVLKTISEQLSFIRADALTGPWRHDSLKQSSVIEDFKSGICNLLVATRIAEDGVEIPPCTCIIRYDLFDSSVSYAHTRSAANGKQCHLILMLDKNADIGRKTVRHVARMSEEVQEWTQLVAVRKEGAYPPAEILQETQVYHSDSEDDMQNSAQYIKDPTMSGRIYPQDSVDVIYRYLSLIQASDDLKLQPVFDYSSILPTLHPRCTIKFPPAAPISIVQGPISVSKVAAKRAACFEACKRLHELGLLSYKLFPRPREVARRLRPVAVSVDEDIEQTKGDILPTLPPAPAPPSQASIPEGTLPQPKVQGLSGTRCYKRKSPEFWKNAIEADHAQFYPTIVTVDRNHNPQKPYRPVLIITTVPLPSTDDFQLFFATMPSVTYLRPALPTTFDKDQLNLLHRYTIRAMRGIFNKAFVCPMEEMPFLIAPLDFGWNIETGKVDTKWPFPDVSDYIPWDLILYAAEQHLVPLRAESLESLEEDIKDAVVQDWWSEYTKRYDCMRVRSDLNPLSPLGSSSRVDKFSTLVDFCKAKRKGFEGLVDYGQPLIEVSNLPSLINRLTPTAKTFVSSSGGMAYSAKFVIPELCSKFTIPASTMRTLTLLPSIMKRVDDALLVRELNAMYFNNEINETTLHAAITAPSASVEVDYERLELLGDAYLKYLSSIYLFVTNPTQHEGILHIARQKIISNKALLVNADKSGLPQYIQSKPYMPKLWMPRGYSIVKPGSKDLAANKDSGKGGSVEIKAESPDSGDIDMLGNGIAYDNGDTETADAKELASPSKAKRQDTVATKSKSKKSLHDDDHQWLGDKCVADVAEAIIGAAFQTAGPDLALRVVKSLHLPLPFIESWEDFSLKAKVPPADITLTLDDNVLETVEVIVGARFQRPHILAQALTHTSVRGNEMICYERLEFLGDAILDFLVIRHIFDLHGRLSPGALTLLKGAMVSNSALAAISVHYGLHQFLKIDSESVKKAIDQYVPEVEESQRAEYAAARDDGRPCGQYWLDIEPPKSIADVVESVLGALYVSDGFKLDGAQAMYDALLRPFYDQHISLKTLSHHPTKILFELFQSRGCQEFEITKQMDDEEHGLYRCEVVVHDVILAGGVDPAPTFAARRASFEALDALEGDPQFMDRLCDCRAKAEQRKAAKRAARAQSGKPEPKATPIETEEDEDDS